MIPSQPLGNITASTPSLVGTARVEACQLAGMDREQAMPAKSLARRACQNAVGGIWAPGHASRCRYRASTARSAAQHPRCRLSVAARRGRLQSAATIRADHARMQRHCNRDENRVKTQRAAGCNQWPSTMRRPRWPGWAGAQPAAGRRLALTSEELALRLSIGSRTMATSRSTASVRRLTPEIQERPV